MTSKKCEKVRVYKPYNYRPISIHEKKRIKEVVTAAILDIANQFDGPSNVTIKITAKGNA